MEETTEEPEAESEVSPISDSSGVDHELNRSDVAANPPMVSAELQTY